MKENKISYKTINEYIAQFPSDVQEKLQTLRNVIKQAAPNSVEKISYQMPAFYYLGNLVYFAVFKNYIGFYPTPGGIAAFKKELSKYKGAKGTVKFPIDKPLPYELISKIVKYRVDENMKKAQDKLGKK